MEFYIDNAQVSGLERSLVAGGNSYRTEIEHHDPTERDWKRSRALGQVDPGTGHDTILNGITVIMDVYAPLYWWKQAQRYHWFEFISSQSTMHCVTKFKMTDQCTSEVDPQIVEIVQQKIDNYNTIKDNESISDETKQSLWHQIIASLPCGFVLGATMTTNYRQLKTMYKQRKNHHLHEWHLFCDWCETLPHFSELTGCGLDEEK